MAFGHGKKRSRVRTNKWAKRRVKGFKNPEKYEVTNSGQILDVNKEYIEIKPNVMKRKRIAPLAAKVMKVKPQTQTQ